MLFILGMLDPIRSRFQWLTARLHWRNGSRTGYENHSVERFLSIHPPFTLVPAQPVREVLNASRDRLNEMRELAAYESKWRRLVAP